ncbi:RDD family protein [Neobacillus drentensis]|uniref:RDD family protein n=1 Tax=Neobacillus drentensis TaxID=220684 RepID=UPI002FFED741
MILAPLQHQKKLYEDTHLSVYEVSSEESNKPQMLRLFRGVTLSEEKLDLWFSNYDDYQMTVTNYKNLPRVISVNYENDNQAYALLEFEKGRTLAERAQMSNDELEQLLEAVDHLHRKNFVHGSIQAENIWITEKGKVLLFGAGEWKAFGLPFSNKEKDVEQLAEVVKRYALIHKERLLRLQKGVESLKQLRDIMFSDGTSERVKGTVVEKNVKGSLVEKPYEESTEKNHKPNDQKLEQKTNQINNQTTNRKPNDQKLKQKINQINNQTNNHHRLSEERTYKVNEQVYSLDHSKFGGFWKRLLAYFIDYLIVFVPLYMIFGDSAPIFNLLLSWVYFAWMESSKMQATLGKKVFGLKVINQNGRKITFKRATGRYFAKYISIFTLGIGYLMAAFTKRKQGLHDKIASTFIISVRN